MTPDIDRLLDAVEGGEPDAAKTLAALVRVALEEPDRTVAVALGLRDKARRDRDNAIREVRRHLPADLSLRKQAETIIREFRRYRPSGSKESDPKRRAYQRIGASGEPFPTSIRHVLRILKR